MGQYEFGEFYGDYYGEFDGEYGVIYVPEQGS